MHGVRSRGGFLALSLFTGLAGLAPPARAQSPERSPAPGDRLSGTAGLSTLGLYDDNIFAVAGDAAPGDAAIRLNPHVDAAFRATPSVTVSASASADSEFYAENHDLSDLLARGAANLGLVWAQGPATSLRADLGAATSNTPRDLLEGTGLELERRRASSWSAGAGASRRLAGDASVALDYGFRQTDFDDPEPGRAHTLTLGWSRPLGERTSIALRAGGQAGTGGSLTETEWNGVASASLRRRFGWGSGTASYSHTANTGPDGLVIATDSFAVAATREGRRSFGTVAPEFFRNGLDGRSTTVLRVRAEAGFRLTRLLHLRGIYQFSRQTGDLSVPPAEDAAIVRNFIGVGLSVSERF